MTQKKPCEHENYLYKKPIVPIYSGQNSKVYLVKNASTGQKGLLKVIDHWNEKEFVVAKSAGEKGIGAKIYDHGSCRESNQHFMFMERLSPLNMSDVFVTDPLLMRTIQMFIKLVLDYKILQNDFKAKNVIVGPDDQVHIIDYGVACELEKVCNCNKTPCECGGIKTYVVDNTNLLLDSLTFGRDKEMAENAFKDMSDIGKEDYFKRLVSVACILLREFFNDQTIMMRVRTDGKSRYDSPYNQTQYVSASCAQDIRDKRPSKFFSRRRAPSPEVVPIAVPNEGKMEVEEDDFLNDDFGSPERNSSGFTVVRDIPEPPKSVRRRI